MPEGFELVNITCEAFTMVLMVILVMATTGHVKTRKQWLLYAAMWLHLITVTGDLFACLYDTVDTGFARVATSWGNAVAYLFGALTYVSIMLYVTTSTSGQLPKDRLTRLVVAALFTWNCLRVLVILTNPWTHAYYFIDGTNTFVSGPFREVQDPITLLQVLVLIPVVISHRESIGSKAVSRIIACGVLGTIGVLFNYVDQDLALLYPAIALSLVLLSAGVQTRLEEDLVVARAESAESRVRLLSGQIRPHFVFNSLTAIKQLVSEDPDKAETAIQDFSDYLRSHLDTMATSRMIPFSAEMEHVRHYVSLEMADPTQPIRVDYNLYANDFPVPPLTVQPLVENAIRHGLRTRQEGGVVTITSLRVPGFVEIIVTDDGSGFSSVTTRQEEHRQVGIENVRERLERQCSGSLEVTSSDAGTKAVIRIPEVS